jgi:transcription initiation factor TFIIB
MQPLTSLTSGGNTPKTLDEIARATGISKRTLGRCYRRLLERLRLKPRLQKSEDYLPRLASDLKVTPAVQREALKILRTHNLKGKTPIIAAATALYLASKNNGTPLSQREIAEVAKITEVSIRNYIHHIFYFQVEK